MQNEQGRHIANMNISNVSAASSSPANTTKWGSQYEAMECFLNDCRWLQTETDSFALCSFSCRFPGWCVIPDQRGHRTTNPERGVTGNIVCAFLTIAFEMWLLQDSPVASFYSKRFSKSIENYADHSHWTMTEIITLWGRKLNIFVNKKGIKLGHWGKQHWTDIKSNA